MKQLNMMTRTKMSRVCAEQVAYSPQLSVLNTPARPVGMSCWRVMQHGHRVVNRYEKADLQYQEWHCITVRVLSAAKAAVDMSDAIMLSNTSIYCETAGTSAALSVVCKQGMLESCCRGLNGCKHLDKTATLPTAH